MLFSNDAALLAAETTSHSVQAGPDILLAMFVGALLTLAAVATVSAVRRSGGRSFSWGNVLLGGLVLVVVAPVALYFVLLPLRFVGRSPQPAKIVLSERGPQKTRSADQVAMEAAVYETFNTSRPQPGASALPAEAPDPLARSASEGSKSVSEKDNGASQAPQANAPSPAAATASSSDAPLPDWVKEQDIREGDKRLLVLTSGQYATIEEADAEILEQARQHVRRDLQENYPHVGVPPVPDGRIALGRRHVEKLSVEFSLPSGTHTSPMCRIYRQLELSPATRQKLEPLWRDQIAKTRLAPLATLAGFLTLVVATFAGYFRLDTRTGSAYRGRLRFAAACLIAAGGAVVLSLA